MVVLFFLLLSKVLGHIKIPVEIKLSLKPDVSLSVEGIHLTNTTIEKKGGRYAITIGNSYLSGNGTLNISKDEFYWDAYDRELGTIIYSEDQCLTYTRGGLGMLPCLDPSDFRSASQLFQVDPIARMPKGASAIHTKMNLVGKVDRLVEPLNRRIADMVDRMDSFEI
ncbi:hypothetical protein KMI_08g13320 [Encephalitozoon hellem]|nr:hypothetical protein KMI_08g13320 [Encephalitozoon hellem]